MIIPSRRCPGDPCDDPHSRLAVISDKPITATPQRNCDSEINVVYSKSYFRPTALSIIRHYCPNITYPKHPNWVSDDSVHCWGRVPIHGSNCESISRARITNWSQEHMTKWKLNCANHQPNMLSPTLVILYQIHNMYCYVLASHLPHIPLRNLWSSKTLKCFLKTRNLTWMTLSVHNSKV